MAHSGVHDESLDFYINPDTRAIEGVTKAKITIVQNDHNSEQFTFKIPRYIEGHDMIECNRIEVHYNNVNSSTREQVIGVYEIEDLHLDEIDQDNLYFTWLVSQNATKHVGTLNFVIRFACLNGERIEYAWNTIVNSDVVISSSIYNGEAVIEEYYDILEQWERKVGVGVSDVEQSATSTESEGVNVITLILTDNTRHSFEVRNGKTPVKGTDYWTEQDKQEIINTILGVVPNAEEASF